MANEHLATYLNDHLAGSVVALELLEHLESSYAGTALESFFKGLSAEITADREKLEGLMSQLEIKESRPRKASAWLTEKVTALKLLLDDPADGDLRLFESLEALSLGIEGKRGLWLALTAVAERSPQMRVREYQELISRAEAQRRTVEEKRIETARRALV